MLVSARDPGTLFDLRVSIREKLITWLQGYEHGAHIPRTRMVLSAPVNGARPTMLAAAPAAKATLAPASSPAAAGAPATPNTPGTPAAPHTPTLIGPSGFPPNPRST
jgi:hypothetical protein